MNKNLMKTIAKVIPPLRTLFSQCEKLTYNEVKTGLEKPTEDLVIDNLKAYSETGWKSEGGGIEPVRLGLELSDDQGGIVTYLNFGQWRELRAYVDSVFVADDPECLAHIDGSVLLECQNQVKVLHQVLWDKVVDLEEKRSEAKEIARTAEDFWFPDHKKPYGPLFGDQPQDEARAPSEVTGEQMEIEEFDPVTDPAKMLPAAVFTGPGEAEFTEHPIDVAAEMGELDFPTESEAA